MGHGWLARHTPPGRVCEGSGGGGQRQPARRTVLLGQRGGRNDDLAGSDDPKDLSGSGELPAPTVQSTFALNEIDV
jgi:hypothetical protein